MLNTKSLPPALNASGPSAHPLMPSDLSTLHTPNGSAPFVLDAQFAPPDMGNFFALSDTSTPYNFPMLHGSSQPIHGLYTGGAGTDHLQAQQPDSSQNWTYLQYGGPAIPGPVIPLFASSQTDPGTNNGSLPLSQLDNYLDVPIGTPLAPYDDPFAM